MKAIVFLLQVTLVLVIASCGNRGDKAADVSEQKDIENDMEGAVAYAFDLGKSNVYWIGSKVVGKHDGTIGIKEGTAWMKDDKLVGGKVVIDMSTITVLDLTDPGTNAKLKGHLDSDDFFSTDKFKTSSFEVAEVNIENGKYLVAGNLTIKNITNAITFPLSVSKVDNRYMATADFDIDRTQWDIKYGSGKFFDKLGDNMISDNFNIRFEIFTESM
jgi:polyisoprenoid-binding protein YceI